MKNKMTTYTFILMLVGLVGLITMMIMGQVSWSDVWPMISTFLIGTALPTGKPAPKYPMKKNENGKTVPKAIGFLFIISFLAGCAYLMAIGEVAKDCSKAVIKNELCTRIPQPELQQACKDTVEAGGEHMWEKIQQWVEPGEFSACID